MTAPFDAIRAKVEEVRREHVRRDVTVLGNTYTTCVSNTHSAYITWPCDALTGWEAALKMAEEHAEFLVVGGWTKPWAERFDVILADIAEGLK